MKKEREGEGDGSGRFVINNTERVCDLGFRIGLVLYEELMDFGHMIFGMAEGAARNSREASCVLIKRTIELKFTSKSCAQGKKREKL